MATFTATIVSDDELVCGDHVQTTTAIPAPGVDFKRGDLVEIDANNVATLAATPGTWDAIVVYDMTPAQATSHATDGVGFGLYNQGEFRVDRVTLAGVRLTPVQFDAAISNGTKRNIELRKPAASV